MLGESGGEMDRGHLMSTVTHVTCHILGLLLRLAHNRFRVIFPCLHNMSGAAASAGASRFSGFMNHPAGPKTVFFWAPVMKWCLVAAGLKDLNRPAEKLSVSQNLALAATGVIWVRYSFVIIPVNYSLAAVNFFVGATGLGQLARIAQYRYAHPQVVEGAKA
jgi:hypothetical protein